MGRWYGQFRYEASFQKDLELVSADYSLNRDGSIRVVNSGRKGGVDGKPKTAVGKAKIVDRATNAKLKVSLFGPSMATTGFSIMATGMNGPSLVNIGALSLGANSRSQTGSAGDRIAEGARAAAR